MALSWRHAESQRRRFDVIAEVAGFTPDSSMLDLGCGTGDLRAFLDELCGRPTGADVHAARRGTLPRAPLLVGHDIDEVAGFCRKLAPEVEVVRGYAEDDAMLALRRRAG